jgi:hypothetical protein
MTLKRPCATGLGRLVLQTALMLGAPGLSTAALAAQDSTTWRNTSRAYTR